MSMKSGSIGGGGGPPTPPVFAFPSQLDFYLEDQTTHKRVLTIYNPYEVEITFKILCNNPKKYAVVEPEGRISGQRNADIVIRHVAVSPQALNQTDKFRIHMYDDVGDELLGKRDILAVLHPGSPDSSTEKQSHSLPQNQRNALLTSPSTASFEDVQRQQSSFQHQQPNVVACLAAVICIASLFLPTEGDKPEAMASFIRQYPWLHLTVNQKLVFAYVLGLTTMAILRPS